MNDVGDISSQAGRALLDIVDTSSESEHPFATSVAPLLKLNVLCAALVTCRLNMDAFSVVVSFFICWLPFHIQRLLSLFITYHDGNVSPAVETLFSLVYYISGCCYYSNSAINPILYNLFSEKYRKAFCLTILGARITKRIRPHWQHSRNGLRQLENSSAFPSKKVPNTPNEKVHRLSSGLMTAAVFV
ncbi:unnamed protein product [Heligmosomoides polygyrus]|uniref:G_PROTEIN_RECEP_F1_2 domain-containing protein n=1 Tax=Heligmosomoides polygyrus TaxID=6339 RepID=A0A183FPV7_HELPZ|nr:unnamed protein product [Heligmosomoides polygyrus]